MAGQKLTGSAWGGPSEPQVRQFKRTKLIDQNWSLSQQIKRIEDELGDFSDEDVLAEKRSKFNALNSSLGRSSGDLERLTRDINDLDAEISDLERILSQNTNDNLGSKLASKLAAAQDLNKILDNALTNLREKLRATVELKATEAFLAMTSRPEDYSGLKITNSYGLHIIDHKGEVVPTRSSGAEQVVALALINGLNRTGKNPGPVIMDTPLGRLDKTHRRRILTYMPTSCTQLVLFVHSGELEDGDAIIRELGPRIGRRYQIRSHGAYHSEIEVSSI